jgi:hypothetical protein
MQSFWLIQRMSPLLFELCVLRLAAAAYHYSCRSAVTGSTRIARRAGITHASSEDDPDAGDEHAVADDQQEHVASVGAKCEANAQLPGPTRDREREHAVDPNRGKQQRESAEDPEQPCAHAGCVE